MSIPKSFETNEAFRAVLIKHFSGQSVEEIERRVMRIINPEARPNICTYFDFVEPVSTSLIAKSIYKEINDTGNG